MNKTDFDINYYHQLQDIRLNTNEFTMPSGKLLDDRLTLDLDLERFLDDYIHATFEDSIANNLEAFVCSRVSTSLSKIERCIFIAERQGEKNDKLVLIFGMYVEEHNEYARRSERYRVYIQFISKSGLQMRKFYPTIPQVILLGYIRFVELLGYDYAHLWIDPPEPGVDYIFKGTHYFFFLHVFCTMH